MGDHGDEEPARDEVARVVVRERCNARHLTRAEVVDPIDLAVCDASFISLRLYCRQRSR